MKSLMIVALLSGSFGLSGCSEVALQAAQFTLDVTPHSVQVARGAAATLTAQITRGLNLPVGTPVTVKLSDAPDGVVAPDTSVRANQTSAEVQLTVGSGVAPGSYSLTFKGTGGLGEQTSTVDLQVK